jgi:beta-lactamase class D
MTKNWDRPLWTRRHVLRIAGCGFGLAALAASHMSHAAEITERADLIGAFKEQGVAGTFVLYDVSTERFTTVNGERAEKRFVPASTFKIANSLIALETGVVKDENEVIPYGGKPQRMKQWENDLSMRQAIVISAVPIYQELARRVGLPRYREWLEKLNYGNRATGDNVETFWLSGPLEISAMELARFVAALALSKLPASERNQAKVRDILKLEDKEGRTLYGKTGWGGIESGQQIGWWTGWVDNGGKISAFALNIDMDTVDDARKRQEIARTILAKLGVY